MPLVTPALGNPYPSIESVLNLARVRVNDASNDLAGDLLTNDAPYTETILNSAWRWLQGMAYTSGVETPIQEIILYGLPLQASRDAANQAHVTWMGCSDGVNQYETPALPQNLIQPLSVWRRQASTSNAFCLMKQADDGLSVWLDYNIYDWRQDGLYFYANTFAQDLRIRYAAYHPDLLISEITSTIPMMMCEDCLSARIAFEYANLRGAAQAPKMEQMALDAFNTIAQRTSRRKQRATFRRKPAMGRGYSNPWPVIN